MYWRKCPVHPLSLQNFADAGIIGFKPLPAGYLPPIKWLKQSKPPGFIKRPSPMCNLPNQLLQNIEILELQSDIASIPHWSVPGYKHLVIRVQKEFQLLAVQVNVAVSQKWLAGEITYISNEGNAFLEQQQNQVLLRGPLIIECSSALRTLPWKVTQSSTLHRSPDFNCHKHHPQIAKLGDYAIQCGLVRDLAAQDRFLKIGIGEGEPF
jgi:hypothetical protein